MTLDKIYQNRNLVALYDALNPAGADTAFYEKMAQDADSVLDIGCGTGLLTARLAQLGKDVTGVDPATEMLAIARQRPAGARVNWHQGDAGSLSLGRKFDLVIMTGHVFQVFQSDQDALAALTTAFHHLAPGGKLVFESRNPEIRGWQDWIPEKTRKTVTVADIGDVTIEHDLQSVAGEYVSFETRHYFPGKAKPNVLTSHSTLRFMDRDTIANLLATAGFDTVTWRGTWQGDPAQDDSPELIAIAVRA
ncbi:class I SAM-dependent methyltransferase [Thalassospira mesophila]|uniref:Methyltransferase domain-containing protein n=1 Tax=Thalassospira mesophila TaxID=1293891 RepID=A0A1Y2L4Y2_9PROT|nr:class I SAM-dependent methyltransferase [Thalassospira mesophila]OSQ40906.1 hypothetical protein TMES_00330 [Thalassospira mesophila]